MTHSLAVKLGKKIRELRKNAGHSQESFGYKLGLHRTYIGSIERGEKNLTLKNLEKVAQNLNIKISDLLSMIDY